MPLACVIWNAWPKAIPTHRSGPGAPARQVGGVEALEVVAAENLSAAQLVSVEDLESQVGGDELRACPERRLDVQAEPQLDRDSCSKANRSAPRAVSVQVIWHMRLCT
jgi:hypothetical protein